MPYTQFNLDQAAKYLHLDRSTLEELVKHNEIPYQRRGGRIFFNRAQLDAWSSRRILRMRDKSLVEFYRSSGEKSGDVFAARLLLVRLVKQEWIEPALSSRTKPSILRDMVDLADRTGLVCDPRDLLASLEAREQLCPTAMEGGIALLHPQHYQPHLFMDSFVVLGRTIQPVHAGAPDQKPTDIFFLICCKDSSLHLHLLARICTMCLMTDLLTALRRATDAAEMYTVLIKCEEETLRLA